MIYFCIKNSLIICNDFYGLYNQISTPLLFSWAWDLTATGSHSQCIRLSEFLLIKSFLVWRLGFNMSAFQSVSQKTPWFPGALGTIVATHLKLSQLFSISNIFPFVNPWLRPYVLWSLLQKILSWYLETGTAQAKFQHMECFSSEPLTFLSAFFLVMCAWSTHAHTYTFSLTYTQCCPGRNGFRLRQYHICCCYAARAQYRSKANWYERF